MKRSGRRAAGAIRAVLVVSVLATSARGQVPEARVAVECSALDAEHRAALEARAKSGLIVRQATGVLQFECRGTAGVVSWTPFGAATARDAAPLPADSNLAVETLLEVAERLFTRVPETATPAPVGAASPPPPPVEAAAPPVEVPPPPPAGPPPLPPDRRPDERSRSDGGGLPVAVAAGVAAEYWDSVLAIGPGALVGLHVLESLRIDAGGTVLFSTEQRLQISGRLVRLHAGAEIRANEHFRVGARLLVDAMTATPEAVLGVSGASDVSPAARVHAAYALPFGGGFSLVAGPFAGLRAEPVRVELGSREAFRIPAVTGGLEVQIEWDAL